jgi:hypothetical protein
MTVRSAPAHRSAVAVRRRGSCVRHVIATRLSPRPPATRARAATISSGNDNPVNGRVLAAEAGAAVGALGETGRVSDTNLLVGSVAFGPPGMPVCTPETLCFGWVCGGPLGRVDGGVVGGGVVGGGPVLGGGVGGTVGGGGAAAELNSTDCDC